MRISDWSSDVCSSDLFGNDLTLTPRLEYTRIGSIWWDVINTPGSRRSPVELVDARLTLAKADRWSLSLFGKNIFNEKYNRSVLPLLGVFQLTDRKSTRLNSSH